MPGAAGKSVQTQLTLAVAQGVSVAVWARVKNVPERTAYRWSRQPEVRAMIDSFRRRATDRARGIIARRATWAAGEIATIAREGKSDTPRLSGCRTIRLPVHVDFPYLRNLALDGTGAALHATANLLDGVALMSHRQNRLAGSTENPLL